MRSADAQLSHPGPPVRLVDGLRHDHLRRSGTSRRSRGAGSAVMHDGGHAWEQRLLIDLSDHEAVVLIVEFAGPGEAATDDQPAPPSADRLDGLRGDGMRDAHAAEAQ